MCAGSSPAAVCFGLVRHVTRIENAALGLSVALSEWALSDCSACRVEVVIKSTPHRSMFAEIPTLVGDSSGKFTLRFRLHTMEVVRPVCFKTCIRLGLRWLHGNFTAKTHTVLEVLHDPCQHVPLASRSAFLKTQLSAPSAWSKEMAALRAAYDGKLGWGIGQTVAVVGGALRRNASYTKYQPYLAPPIDEDRMWNPSWDNRVPPHGRSKLVGSVSFLPDVSSFDAKAQRVLRTLSGHHEFQVAWLAAQASGFKHTHCRKELKKFACADSAIRASTDAHDGTPLIFERSW